MTGDLERRDKREARTLVVALGVMGLVLAVAAVLAFPLLAEFHANHLAPGLGMKDAAVISLLTTLVVLVVFAVAAGDGLLGEIQFMLVGFFAFFLFLWVMIGWVF